MDRMLRPLAVIREYWNEVISLEENAEILEPVYIVVEEVRQ